MLPNFLPDFATLFTYTLACLALFIVPGPDMSFCIAKTLSGGVRMGVVATCGVLTGLAAHTALAVIGISALIAASPAAFHVVKMGGALYLIFLAVQAVRSGSSFVITETRETGLKGWSVFIQGFFIDFLNPKPIFFFVSFLPQFIQPEDPFAWAQLLFLGVYLIALFFPLTLLLVFFAGKLSRKLKDQPRVMRALDYAFAGLFGTFAAKLLVF
jgi:threonine/homoserine/homoserine lactone efflux protein